MVQGKGGVSLDIIDSSQSTRKLFQLQFIIATICFIRALLLFQSSQRAGWSGKTSGSVLEHNQSNVSQIFAPNRNSQITDRGLILNGTPQQ